MYNTVPRNVCFSPTATDWMNSLTIKDRNYCGIQNGVVYNDAEGCVGYSSWCKIYDEFRDGYEVGSWS